MTSFCERDAQKTEEIVRYDSSCDDIKLLIIKYIEVISKVFNSAG